jgi:hypothetical protein
MAQFYGYDEKGLGYYGDGGSIPMRPTYGMIKDAYPDVPTATTCYMHVPPWETPVEDMVYYHCDRMIAEKKNYNYTDGEILRGRVKPGLPGGQRFQYWAYYGFPLIVAPLLYARSSFWSLFQQQADGFLYYSVNGWWQLPSTPPPIDPMLSAHAPGGPVIPYTYSDPTLPPEQRQRERVASSGVLVYRGTAGPLASMRMVNIRDGMQDWEYLWAIGHYDADGVTRLGKIASVETARELAEEISSKWNTDPDPARLVSIRDGIAAWLSQPYVAKYPTPEHRSTGVSTSPTLTWQSDSATVESFDVYFGADKDDVLGATKDSPEFKGNQNATTFNPSGPLARNTLYYWRIDEVVGARAYNGYVWTLSCSHGLVGWWKFDEAAGTIAKDSSTFDRQATVANATHVAGIVNNGLQFTGGASVSIPPSVLSTIGGQITIAFWLHGADAQPQDGVAFEALTAGGVTVLRGRMPSLDGVAYFEAGASDVVRQPMTLTQARRRWQHWTFTKNAETGHMKIYFNGALWAEAGGQHQVMEPATVFKLGSKCDGTLGYEGKIDDLRVYDRELTSDEISTLYGSAGRRGDRGLMGWWRFDELSGPTVQDWSDLKNHGTLNSTNQVRQVGRLGNCQAFNGTSDYIDVPVTDMDLRGMAVTLSLWAYGDTGLPASTAFGSVAVSAVDVNDEIALLACIPLSDGTIFFRASRSQTNVVVAPQLPYKDQWNHWVFTRGDSGLIHIYLNGIEVWSDRNVSDKTFGTIARLRLGKGCSGGHNLLESSAYKGLLDEIRLYNYELSASEVGDLYNVT